MYESLAKRWPGFNAVGGQVMTIVDLHDNSESSLGTEANLICVVFLEIYRADPVIKRGESPYLLNSGLSSNSSKYPINFLFLEMKFE